MDGFEQLRERLIEWCVQLNQMRAARMVECDAVAVQREAMKAEAFAKEAVVVAFAVADVAHDGLRDVLEMAADLMCSTGVGAGFVQSVALEAAEPAKVRDGFTALGSGLFGEWMIDAREL